ncbi:proprotein convertase subtilisin/kexin type 6-like isoform X2 [Bacillus rossius redtenbacheri]|uniref:proprotein convertase subtilisin/kexin type 6-like isoform X2 n=1 Tax=Bacillus rossius redtenbacheri TaxID=93214 RepID=UPI002FDD1E20
MAAATILLLLLLLLLGAGAWGRQVYHNQFAVLVPAGRRQADVIAERHGFANIGQIGQLPGYFLLEHRRVHKRSAAPSQPHLDRLTAEPEVHWVQQQYEKIRRKRDLPRCAGREEQTLSENNPCPLDWLAPGGSSGARGVAAEAVVPARNFSTAGVVTLPSPENGSADASRCGPSHAPVAGAAWELQNDKMASAVLWNV